jgi:hypothetical protein
VETTISKTYSSTGTYLISAYAKDVNNAESDIVTLEVSIPKNKLFDNNYPLLGWLFERFPNMFPILRQILRI